MTVIAAPKNTMAIIAIALVLLYLALTAIKLFILLRRGGNLITRANYSSQYSVGSPAQKAITYLVMGDSTAVGVGASTVEHTYPYAVAQQLSGQGSSVRVVTIAKSGATVHDVVTEQLPKIAEIKPEIISISIGGNDATHVTSQVSFENDIKTIIAALNESGAKMVLFGSTPNMFAIPALPRWFSWLAGRRSMQQNELTKSLLPPSFRYVDIFNKARLQGLPDYAQDWFHPNDRGYERWSKAFTESMVRTGT
ncbi:SGNH/GDSL hydrolase family protein [Candidatus Berkelbacteria bacterium]|nr:SGNH/GDSL hydrolase family protein [Candidatus Berkelbacteria bacterium]